MLLPNRRQSNMIIHMYFTFPWYTLPCYYYYTYSWNKLSISCLDRNAKFKPSRTTNYHHVFKLSIKRLWRGRRKTGSCLQPWRNCLCWGGAWIISIGFGNSRMLLIRSGARWTLPISFVRPWRSNLLHDFFIFYFVGNLVFYSKVEGIPLI